MAHIIPITDLSAPQLDLFARLTEAQLRNKREPEQGIFVAESPKVIALALDAGLIPKALLMEQRHLTGQGAPLLDRCGDVPVYTASREVLTPAGWRCWKASWTPPTWGPSFVRQPGCTSTPCSSPPPAATL